MHRLEHMKGACISASSPISCMHAGMVCSMMWQTGRCLAADSMEGSMCTAYPPSDAGGHAAPMALRCKSLFETLYAAGRHLNRIMPHAATVLQAWIDMWLITAWRQEATV